ncbi:Glycosyltransferase involved in cell wall bisynthesis [Syntrophus gentianae]|uniref:Glycosyltransferase involved in cell wall bisynthesis n=1 Tax=Syntrophus gentianae TaxID=43775 RepID=A0A1H7X6R2_9BACT|nr:glycosyltransferase family 2 protein [Syntrophus gentianae]SEM29552.1 Glycosyltransferase involved in cell wall bisynthesis [Syntrophus gentianae]
MISEAGLVSIIIPVFNRAKFLQKTVNSVLSQTYPNIEVILVDDCSTDDSFNVMKELQDHDSRIECFRHEKNAGAQSARNTGIRNARGKWIAFQDSDDKWMPDKIEKQLAVLSAHGFDPWIVVHTNCLRYEEDTGNKEIWKLPVVEGENVYPALLKNPGPTFSSLLTSKSALEKMGFLDEKTPSYQEWETSLGLARYCRFIHIKEPLFIYTLHNQDRISNDIGRDIVGYHYILKKYEKDIKEICGIRAWNYHLFHQSLKCIRCRDLELFDLCSEGITCRFLSGSLKVIKPSAFIASIVLKLLHLIKTTNI